MALIPLRTSTTYTPGTGTTKVLEINLKEFWKILHITMPAVDSTIQQVQM